MKATGIVRRIDDLGRIVIPKEIRRTMHIREGDPLEIYTDNSEGVIFRKYSPVGGLSDISESIADSINRACGAPVAVCDRDRIVAAAGAGKKEYASQPISGSLSSVIASGKSFSASAEQTVNIVEGRGSVSCLSPILSGRDVIGAVISLQNGKNGGEIEKKLIETGAYILSGRADY